MPQISAEKLFEQVFAQAGYAGCGLRDGVREVLLRHAEDLARETGLKEAYDCARKFIPLEWRVDYEPSMDGHLPKIPAYTRARGNGAAALSAVVGGTANVMEYLELVQTGSMRPDEAMIKIIGETITSAADSAIKAAGDSAMQMLVGKHGTLDNAMRDLARQGMDALLENLPIGQGKQQLVEYLKLLIDVGRGKAPADKLLEKASALLLKTTGSPDGRIVKIAGKGAVNIVKSKFPKLLSMLPKHPAILSAGVVVAIAGAIAVKNCIERPYRDLVRNTESLNEAAMELERVSQSMLRGQALFGKFLESDAQMEAQLQKQMARIDLAGRKAHEAILKI
ncbi:MAG: hypothetical protein HDQ91_05315 [Desulfovibrio sp.]|nr:hypothetical protein [Desulfovibrio sp.]